MQHTGSPLLEALSRIAPLLPGTATAALALLPKHPSVGRVTDRVGNGPHTPVKRPKSKTNKP